MVSTARLDNRLKYWKTQLIDTSKRNRLLYFKSTPTGTVKLTEPTLQEIFARLVVKEQPFQFYPLEPEENLLDFDDDNTKEIVPFSLPPLRADEIRSNLADKRLWRTLYSLRQKSRSSLQEQGFVTLFVAFGFLEWTEAASSDVRVRSPLILVPVELVQESSRDNYRLTLFEDDITLNPTLVHVLDTNFGMTLPELPDTEALGLDAYFAAVKQATTQQSKWSVVSEAYLSLFSFHKISMYKDLEAHADKACEHPIVRALAGDASRLPQPPVGLPEESELDRVVTPIQTFQILDADSSQQEAIQAAKRGVSFILQGPPGTGKSQTIANIIAELLAERKKVLFVSEKMAALEVVYRRLADRGLSEFCLQAHSHKANKKEVVQQLGSALESAHRPDQQIAPDFSEFLRLRERLNTYVNALHTVRSPLNVTAYQAHGELARYANKPDFHFDFERVADATKSDLTRIDEVIAELARIQDVIASYAEYPWFGVHIPQYNPNQMKADIRAHFGMLVQQLTDAEKTANTLACLCGVAEPSGIVDVDHLLTLAELVGRSPLPPADWFLPDAPAKLIEEAKKYQKRFDAYRKRHSALRVIYEPTLFQLAHADFADRLTERHHNLIERVLAGTQAADELVGQRQFLQTAFSHISSLLERLGKSVPALAEACGLEIPQSMAGIAELCKVAELILCDPKPRPDWFSQARLLELKAQAEEAEPQYASYLKSREQIDARYENTFFSLDLSELYARFTDAYAGIFRILNPGYYRDLKQIRAELKTSGKLSYETAVRDLKAARQAADCKRWIDERSANYARAFGRRYNGLETRWSDILEAIQATRRIVDCLGDGQVPVNLIRLLVASGSAIETIREQHATVQAEFNRLEQEVTSIQRILSLQGLPFTNKPVRDADFHAFKRWIDELSASLSDFLNARDTVIACLQADSAIGIRSIAEIVADLREAQALIQVEADVQAHADELHAEFGRLFVGMDTRWEDILAALDWTGQVLDWFGAVPPPIFVAVASGEQSGAESVPAHITALRSLRQRMDEEAAFLHGLFPPSQLRIGGKPFAEAPLSSLCTWVQVRLDRLADLDKWMDFQNLRTICREEGLASFLAVLCREKPAASVFKPAFYKRFWSLWLDRMYQMDTALASFDGRRHEDYIARFRELDQGQLRMAQNRLRALLRQERPLLSNGKTPTGEMSVLLKEKKKTRHKPLRRLFREMPNLLLALKPCMLMSPLSVATFLDPTVVEFDAVLFDEASQICSEDAVGAIMRGKQVIVVGDSKQLPPTRFFSAGAAEDYDTEEDEEEAATEVYESILDECSTIGLRQWMLRWHYRSRCEALIAFSNRHFYGDKLVTFPGPYVTDAVADDRCVEFVYVPDGIYIRGKGQDAGMNRIEARKVAELVLQHFKMRPDRSLGIIAFSERQQNAIDDELRRLRNLCPDYERFFSDEKDEPFFLKNLENVQGDERDTIFFSVGYGRDQNGKLSMNFGPLNKEGGERRLNVAVTRAKYQIKLISSIQSYDIDLTRTEKKGPALLKNYMEFAQHGPSALGQMVTVPDDPEFDSPFEEEVCRALEERGLKVHRQVGCAGYRIDLAIVDDAHLGRYLLAIECDGRTYHSSKTARDRDRLRQQILEEMGWQGRILRIWSSDWINNRDAQILRVIEALATAKYQDSEAALPSATDAGANQEEETEAEIIDEDAEEEIPDSAASLPEIAVRENDLPDGVVLYHPYPSERFGEPNEFYDLAEYKPGRITDVLVSVVQHEGPIHITEATRRVVSCWGMGKAGANLLRTVQIAASRAQKRGAIQVKGEFLWPAEMTHAVVRVPSDEKSIRNIEFVPIEEIAEACILCIQDAFAIPQDELITQAARLLGYHRTGTKVRERIEEGISFLVKQRRAEVKEGTVRLTRL